MGSVYAYSKKATRQESIEAVKSASLFFDGTESRLIWTELFRLVRGGTEGAHESLDDLHFFRWIVQHFNVKEEEMLSLHIPLVCGYMLDWIGLPSSLTSDKILELSDCATILMELIPARAFMSLSSDEANTSHGAAAATEIRSLAKRFYAGQYTGDEKHCPLQSDWQTCYCN